MKKLLTGNYAVAEAVKYARVDVVAAYPITPQTSIIEKIASLVASNEMNTEYIKVESEHSAMAACIGASITGARVFTATSAHGLALMHEMLHWASGSRLPIVMADVNRGMGPPWSIWADQNDALSQRDTGWLHFYCENNQEVFDTVILAYKVCEKINLPGMLVLDAFILSHTTEPVEIYNQEMIDKFLPPYTPEYKLDVEDVHAFNGLATPEWYYELRYSIHEAMETAKNEIIKTCKEFRDMFGRNYEFVEEYRCDEDIEELLVMSGAMASTGKESVDKLRDKGRKIGLIRIRVFRPFPKERLRKLISSFKSLKRIIVIDRNISFGSDGIFYSELKSALYGVIDIPIINVIAGLGGRDVTVKDIMDISEISKDSEITVWWGLKK